MPGSGKQSQRIKAFLLLIFFFRSQDFLIRQRADLDKLTNHIQTCYPGDEIFQECVNYYQQAGREGWRR